MDSWTAWNAEDGRERLAIQVEGGFVTGKSIRVGEALTKSRKSSTALGGAMVKGDVLKRDLVDGKGHAGSGLGLGLASGEAAPKPRRGVVAAEKRIVRAEQAPMIRRALVFIYTTYR